ncbi:hypothetical protein [Clostridium sp. BJN0013]|uniref:hypothetical protein n=1 Tax=Clostridium sp. BJN0013 TaxID=3236840 RepID=UPI0034C6A60C
MNADILKSLTEQFNLLKNQCQEIVSSETIEPEQYDFLIKASLAMIDITNCLSGYYQLNQESYK